VLIAGRSAIETPSLPRRSNVHAAANRRRDPNLVHKKFYFFGESSSFLIRWLPGAILVIFEFDLRSAHAVEGDGRVGSLDVVGG
jgi:hypothetical protein